MATELYGAYAEIVKSIGSTPVSTDTNIIFVGSCPSGDLSKPVLVTSLADYKDLLGGQPGDGYSLTEGAIAAFQIAGIRQVWMIPVSHSVSFNASDYLGDSSLGTGIYAIETLLRDAPTAVNIICAPSVVDGSVISALDGIAKLADGHWQSLLMYDVEEESTQINASGIPAPATVVEAKQIADAHALAVWGHVKTSGGYIVAGSAVRACLQAKNDASYGAPSRSGGNLEIPAIQGVCIRVPSGTIAHTAEINGSNTPQFTLTATDYTTYSGKLRVVYKINGDSVDEEITFANGVGLGTAVEAGSTLTDSVVYQPTISILPVTVKESVMTQLSADGICSYNYYGSGVYHTWGDHPSIFAGGNVADEGNRFDNFIRVNMMIVNRFQIAHRFEVDQPLTLAMRNDIIDSELDFLNSLKARDALIGNPVCEFRPDRNSTSDLQQGHFVWSYEVTETLPAKYLKAEVAYTTAGISVYTQPE